MVSSPDVSVIIASYNGLPYFEETLASLDRQTIGAPRMQVIAVDDGSTDGTAEYLDGFARAHEWLEVIHQENTGGPSAPRNRALEHVRGRYVFYLDNDDVLADDALRAMVTVADANCTDVVLPRMRGVNGRGTPRVPWMRTMPRTDVFSSAAYWSLNPMKLYRTEVVRREGLYFPGDIPRCDDQPFTAGAYLAANGISILSDRDYVYWVRRRGDENITYSLLSLADRMPVVDLMFDFVAERVAPGPNRDKLMRRHFQIELIDSAFLGYRDSTDHEQRTVAFGRFREIVDAYLTPAIDELLPPAGRILLRDIASGSEEAFADRLERFRGAGSGVLVEGEHVFASLPGFRDRASGLADDLFDMGARLKAEARLEPVTVGSDGLRVEAECRLGDLTGDVTEVALIAKHRAGGGESVLPLHFAIVTELVREVDRPYAVVSGTVAARDLIGTAEPGVHDLYLRLSTGAVARTCRLGECAPPPQSARYLQTGGLLGATGRLFTTSAGNLSVAVKRGALHGLRSSTFRARRS